MYGVLNSTLVGKRPISAITALLFAALAAFAPTASAQDPGAWSLGDFSNRLEDCRTVNTGAATAPFLFPGDYQDAPGNRTCDAWSGDVVERPFSQAQDVYYGGIDIEQVLLGAKTGWNVFGIDVAEIGPTGGLQDFFIFEIDIDGDDRGDFYVEFRSPSTSAAQGVWTQKQLAVYEDGDNSVGLTDPLVAEGATSQNGYEADYWISGNRRTEFRRYPNDVWARVSPDDPTVVEVAMSPRVLRNPTDLSFRGWVAKGAQDMSRDLFYLHDTRDAAGYASPYTDNAAYPLGSLYQIDNSGPVGHWLEPARPSISLDKAVTSGSPYAAPGDLVEYSYTISNTGNVTLAGPFQVTDDLIAAVPAGAGPLVPGASVVVTASYPVTQADIDAGSVTNTASVSTTHNGVAVNSGSDTATATATQTPGISLDKALTSGSPFAAPGDLVEYSYTITNTGNVTLAGPFQVTDDRIAAVPAGSGPLAPGASVVVTASYSATQTDIDNGSVTNTASASTTYGGAAVDSNEDTATATATRNPSLSLDKSGEWIDANGDGIVQVGELISYTFNVTNNGNVTLHNVSLSDPLVTVAGGPIVSLAPGASDATTFSGTYAITQADIEAGQVENTATAGSDESAPASDTETTVVPRTPALSLVKEVTSGSPYAAPGDLVGYSYGITNTGNVTLAGPFQVTDDLIAVVPAGAGPLAPGESVVVTATYSVDQDDIDAGSVTNTASVSTTYGGGPVNSAPDTATALATQNPGISLQKSGQWIDGNGDAIVQVGEEIAYTFTVSNTGNVTLHNVTLSDPLVAIVGGPIVSLAPGASDATTFSGTYAITQEDIDAGQVVNTATVDSDQTDPASDSETTPVAQSPALDLVATSVLGADGVITYTYLVTNTGNVTLFDIDVVEDAAVFTGTGPLPVPEYATGGADLDGDGDAADLAPGESLQFTSTYAVTQDDIDAGGVSSQAQATSSYYDAAGALLTATDLSDDGTSAGEGDNPTETTIDSAPSLSLVKTGTWIDGNGNGIVQAGESINYGFTVTNTGNVTLTNVTLSDPLITVAGGPIVSLAPGASDAVTFSGSYVLTQADVDAGSFTNTATATATFDGSPYTADGSDTRPLPDAPSLAFTKSGSWTDADGDGYGDVGEPVDFTFTVTNTGNVTLTNILVSDPLVGLGPVTCDSGANPVATLAPGASEVCAASYALTPADAAAGEVVNTATADADQTDPQDDSSSVTFPTAFQYVINEDGLPSVSDGSDFDEIRAAFATWQDVPGSRVAFVDQGLTPATRADGTDGINLVTFRDTDFPFPPYVLAIASKTIVDGVVVDGDMVFNPAYVQNSLLQFRTTTSPGNVDIRSTAVHEVGHLVSLLHSVEPSATMFPLLQPGNEARTLEPDDVAWITRLYPEPGVLQTLGSISGAVLDGESTPGAWDGIPGAALLARETTTGELFHAYSGVGGEWSFQALPPGSYKVSVQPLDGDVGPLDQADRYPITTANISAELSAITTNTTFEPEYWNGPDESENPTTDSWDSFVAVAAPAGAPATGIDIITNRDVTPPVVTGFIPADGSSVLTTTEIIVSFSETIDESTLAFSLVQVDGAGGDLATLGGTLFLENDKTLGIFQPDALLAPAASYEIRIGAGLADAHGVVQTASYVSAFSTQADGTFPEVVDVVFEGGQASAWPNSPITVLFSEAMDAASVEALDPGTGDATSIYLETTVAGVTVEVRGSVDLDVGSGNQAAVFTPSVRLDEGQAYTLVVSALVRDTGSNNLLVRDGSGNPLTAGTDFTADFTTADDLTPEVVLHGPMGPAISLGGAVAYAITTPVFADFSEPIDPSTVSTATFRVSEMTGPGPTCSDTAIPGFFQTLNADTRVVFRPASALVVDQDYCVQVEGISDVSDPQLDVLHTVWTFTAEPATGPLVFSAAPPAAVVGTLVTLGGKGFDPDPAANAVTIAGLPAEVTYSTLTGLTFEVPEGTPEGATTIQVVNPGGTSAPFPYTVVAGIDLSDAAIARIVSESGARDTDVSPDGALAYVTNSDNDWVTVIDLVSLSVVGLPIPVGDTPLKIVVHPSGNWAYVTNFLDHTVSVIDLQANPPVVIDEIPVGLNPIGIAAAPDGAHVYVAEYTGHAVSVIDTDPTGGAWNQAISRITTESSNRDVTVSPDGALAFVTGTEGLAVINLDPSQPGFNAVISRVSSETSTRNVDVSPDGALAFVTTMDGAILVVDVNPESSEFAVIARTSSESGARDVTVSPDGAMLFVTNFDGSSVDVYRIDVVGSTSGGVIARDPITTADPGVSLTLIESYDLNQGGGIETPEGLVFSPLTSTLVVVSSSTGNVSVFNFGGNPDVDGNGLPDRREALVAVFYDIISGYGVDVDEALNQWRSGLFPGKSKDPKERILNQLLRALDSLLKSLDSSLWLDAMHLDPSQGGQLFDADRRVIQSIVNVFGETTDNHDLLLGVIDALLQMEIELVETLLDETVCDPGTACQRGYDAAVSELGRALVQYDAGDWERASQTLKSAWSSIVPYAPLPVVRAAAPAGLSGALTRSVEEVLDTAVPTEFALEPNYPNPFNPSTVVRFAVPERAEVRLEVFDVLGRRVRILLNEAMSAGWHEVRFDASGLPSGIYLARMTAAGFSDVRRMVLVR